MAALGACDVVRFRVRQQIAWQTAEGLRHSLQQIVAWLASAHGLAECRGEYAHLVGEVFQLHAALLALLEDEVFVGYNT